MKLALKIDQKFKNLKFFEILEIKLNFCNGFFQDLEMSPWTQFQLYYDAYQAIWTLVLLLGVIVRIRSSFIALIWVFFASLGNVLKSKLFGKWRGKSMQTFS